MVRNVMYKMKPNLKEKILGDAKMKKMAKTLGFNAAHLSSMLKGETNATEYAAKAIIAYTCINGYKDEKFEEKFENYFETIHRK